VTAEATTPDVPDVPEGPGWGRPGSGRAKIRPGDKERVGLRFWPDNTDRARAAFLNTREETGFPTFSDFAEAALMEYVAAQEAKHNGGVPWPPEGPGRAPVGRPKRRR
jgi:hypothetical protein